MPPIARFVSTLVPPALVLLAMACGPAQPAQEPEPIGDAPATPPAASEPPPPPIAVDTPPPAQPAVLTVAALAAGVPAGPHVLEAFVVEVKACPECPPTISCRPCLGDFIVVHDVAAPPADASKPMLKARPGQIKSFEVGKRYRMQINAIATQGSASVSSIEVESAQVLP